MISVAFFLSYADELRLIQMTMGEEPKKSLNPRNCLTLNSVSSGPGYRQSKFDGKCVMCPNGCKYIPQTMLIDFLITLALVLLIQQKKLYLGHLSLSQKGNQTGFTISLMYD